VASDLRARGRRPYVIPVGGTGPIGAAGQVLAGLEVAAQLDGEGLAEVTVVIPSATGGTHAGLIAGLARARPSRRRVVGFTVASPSAELRPTIVALLDGLEPLTGIRTSDDDIDLEDDQLGDGYGRSTDASRAAASLLARTEGILVDPIYTAKALAGLVARVGERGLDGPVVFWHAGGLPGLFERA
jgi:D-cysteine desulfhydrase